MFRRDIESALHLLGLMIVIDRQVKRDEVNCFMACASALQSAAQERPKISQTRLLYWFELKRERLIEMTRLEKPAFQRQIDDFVIGLRDFPNVFLICKMMNKISCADGHIDSRERAFSRYIHSKLMETAESDKTGEAWLRDKRRLAG